MFLFIFFIFFQSCTVTHRVNSKKVTVYEIFDSLENYFSEDIAKHRQEPIQVIIDPYCPNCTSVFSNLHDLFGIALVYDSRHDFNIRWMIHKKGRYFKIHDKLYPVYILRVDDAFVNLLGKNYTSYSRSEPSEFERIYPLMSLQNFILVDLTTKMFIDDKGLRRGKIKK